MSNTWETGICGCCDVKDCGIGCCVKLYCGSLCIWGAAMEKAGLGSCFGCCCGLYCCSPCVLCQGRTSTAAKYGINEGAVESFCYACCCPGCSFIQTVNQILVKENLTWGCCGIEASGGAPEVVVMER